MSLCRGLAAAAPDLGDGTGDGVGGRGDEGSARGGDVQDRQTAVIKWKSVVHFELGFCMRNRMKALWSASSNKYMVNFLCHFVVFLTNG